MSENDNEQMKQLPKEDKPEKTKKLWGKLKQFLLKKAEFEISEKQYLNIIPSNKLADNRMEYVIDEKIRIQIQSPPQAISLEQVKVFNSDKVDSTGISLWPAEEILAHFCLKNLKLFQEKKRIAEFGAGYSGLAGIALGLALLSADVNSENPIIQRQIEISDGNTECAKLLSQNVELNCELHKNLKGVLSARQFIWGDNIEQLEENQTDKFEAIIIADCLFFRDFHEKLIQTLSQVLSGECYIIAPSRGGSRELFISRCEGKLQVEFIEFYDQAYQTQMQKLRESPQYDPDHHEYQFILVKNIKNQLV